MPNDINPEKMKPNLFHTIMDYLTSFAHGITPLPLQEFIDQAERELVIMNRLDDASAIKDHKERLVFLLDLAKAGLDYQKAVKKILPEDVQADLDTAWNGAVSIPQSEELSMREKANAPSSSEVQ